MPRIVVCAAFALACAVSPAFAQFDVFQGPWNAAAQHGTIQGYAARGMGEGALSPKLRGVIAEIRRKFGRGAISGIGTRNAGGTSCHPRNAFDAHLSAAARRYVQGRRDLGVITYSGSMSHVHVSDCARERGYRGHKRG